MDLLGLTPPSCFRTGLQGAFQPPKDHSDGTHAVRALLLTAMLSTSSCAGKLWTSHPEPLVMATPYMPSSSSGWAFLVSHHPAASRQDYKGASQPQRDHSDGIHAVRALLLMLPTSSCFCITMCGQALDLTSRTPRDGNPLHALLGRWMDLLGLTPPSCFKTGPQRGFPTPEGSL